MAPTYPERTAARGGSPAMRILPAEGWRRPRSELITEDFPAPLGPTTAST